MENMLKYLGELDCEADLASIVGEHGAGNSVIFSTLTVNESLE